MSRRQKCRLRELTPEERAQLEQIGRAHTVPASHVARAKAWLAVTAAQHSDTAAARQAGRRSGDAVAMRVARFNPLRMGWQARGKAPASLGTTPSLGRFRAPDRTCCADGRADPDATARPALMFLRACIKTNPLIMEAIFTGDDPPNRPQAGSYTHKALIL
jgi:hypothetical protein